MSHFDQDEVVTRRNVLNAVGGIALLGTSTAATGAATDTPATAAAFSSAMRPANLYPHDSSSRASRDLSGLWLFKLDPRDEGESAGWSNGLTETRSIPVPASWNEIFDDARNYFGSAWYQTDFYVDAGWRGRRVHLRFGAASYRAKVWLNGRLLGEHEGGHLPFLFEISDAVRLQQSNRLVVLVENKLREDRVPAAAKPGSGSVGGYPAVTYDFFPYCGLHRPVLLYCTPARYVDDVTVRTGFDGATGIVDVEFSVSDRWRGAAELSIDGAGAVVTARTDVAGGKGSARLRIPAVRPWGPADPCLYGLSIRLAGHGGDEYRMKVGVRTVEVRGRQLLLNGKPVFLAGFGKHEDFAISGKGLNLPVLSRDYELLKWIGANSFRTAHYPYSDEAMMLADEYGLLVIDETPAVSLDFSDGEDNINARQRQHARALAEMMARDKNHPCVVLWSVANEPGINLRELPADKRAPATERGTAYFRPLFDYVRAHDATRPVALVSVGMGPDEWIGLGDIACVNVYFGWYYAGPGQLDTVARPALEKELDRLRAKFDKPIMVTEFGADTLPGMHAQPSEMWSEEYQAEMMSMYMGVIRQRPEVVGAHPWAFADFRTSQGILRAAGMNHKGVFTRERRPKLAAHRLRELWKS